MKGAAVSVSNFCLPALYLVIQREARFASFFASIGYYNYIVLRIDLSGHVCDQIPH